VCVGGGSCLVGWLAACLPVCLFVAYLTHQEVEIGA